MSTTNEKRENGPNHEMNKCEIFSAALGYVVHEDSEPVMILQPKSAVRREIFEHNIREYEIKHPEAKQFAAIWDALNRIEDVAGLADYMRQRAGLQSVSETRCAQ